MSLSSDLVMAMRTTNESSCSLTDMVLSYVRNRLKTAQAAGDAIEEPEWGNKLFRDLWTELVDAGVNKSKGASGMGAFVQVLDRLASVLRNDIAFKPVYKNEHYYRAAQMLMSIGAVEMATEYFMLIDEEDALKSGSAAGAAFRQHDRLGDLRRDVVSLQMGRTHGDFHDGIGSSDDRSGLLVRAVLAMPRLYVASRCQTGLWRVCYLESRGSVNFCLRTVEELGVLCEGIARILDGGSVGAVNAHRMLGKHLLKKGKPCGDFGFVQDGFVFKPDDPGLETASRSTLQQARSGNKGAIAAVVNWSRNQAMHVTDAADWYFDESVLRDVIKVLLDFVSTIAHEYETKHGKLSSPRTALTD